MGSFPDIFDIAPFFLNSGAPFQFQNAVNDSYLKVQICIIVVGGKRKH